MALLPGIDISGLDVAHQRRIREVGLESLDGRTEPSCDKATVPVFPRSAASPDEKAVASGAAKGPKARRRPKADFGTYLNGNFRSVAY